MAHDALPVRWTRRALLDLDHIVQHVSANNPIAAQRLARGFHRKAASIGAFPSIGREHLHGVRELLVHRNYLLTYRIRLDAIEILQVWHVARQR